MHTNISTGDVPKYSSQEHCKANDLSVQSLEVKMSSCFIKLRNKRFIKHLSKKNMHGERDVQFQLSDNLDPQLDNRGVRRNRENLTQTEQTQLASHTQQSQSLIQTFFDIFQLKTVM